MPLSVCSRRPAADSWGRDPSERAWRSCSERAAGGSELTRGEQPDIFAPCVGVKRPADFVRARQPSDAWARRVLAIAIAAKLHEYSNGALGQRGYGWCSPTTGVVERVLGGVAVHSIHAASTATPVAISGTESPPLEPYGVTVVAATAESTLLAVSEVRRRRVVLVKLDASGTSGVVLRRMVWSGLRAPSHLASRDHVLYIADGGNDGGGRVLSVGLGDARGALRIDAQQQQADDFRQPLRRSSRVHRRS